MYMGNGIMVKGLLEDVVLDDCGFPCTLEES